MRFVQAAVTVLVATVVFALSSAGARAETWVLADGKAWPGRILTAHDGRVETLLVRSERQPEDAIPRVQTLTFLNDGRLVFASGLDRKLFELTRSGERELRNGGYLVRKVRTAADGTLYWSGLETPIDNNPLPDGFIYSWNPTTGESRTVLTFSQGDVGHDWWGSFDVRDGKIYVGTLRGQTLIYNVSVSPVELVATLPVSAQSFRFAADGSLLACDGAGKLLRFGDLTQPEKFEVVLNLDTPFVDFATRDPQSAPSTRAKVQLVD